MNSHRQRSRRRTMTWQAGSLTLLAAAVGVGAIPLARTLGPGSHVLPKGPDTSTAPVAAKSMSASQVVDLAAAMKDIGLPQVAPPPPPVDITPVVEVASTEVEPAAAAVLPTSWSYTGFMRGPNIKRAIITVGTADSGQQVSLGEGDKHESTKLVEIQPDHIMVEDAAGVPKRIDLAERSAAAKWDMNQPRHPAAATARGPNGLPQPGMAGMGMGMGGQPGMGAANAVNMAEMQRRMRAAIAPVAGSQRQNPVEERNQKLESMAKEIGQLGQDKKDALTKMMFDPNLNPEDRGKLMREMGLPTDLAPDERDGFLQNIGVHPDNDTKLYNFLREGSTPK